LKKIGLLGGTFDPVHNGHVKIARSFIESGLIEELWILLTPFPPHKQQSNHVSYSKRLEMLEAAFSDVNCSVLSIEKDLPKPSFTYRTIQALKKEHPNYDFFFCMGEDSLSQFHTWKHFDKILNEASLLVARRPNYDHSKVQTDILEHTVFVDHEPIEIASSDIKSKILDTEYLKKNLPPKVVTIIDKENLYR
jgi:nicotinate-nucleotide adenylyltransferase